MTLGARVKTEISGEQFRAAVERSGMTNKQVADLLGLGLTQVSTYKQTGVVQKNVLLVRERMAPWLTSGENPLSSYSDMALLAELARRLSHVRQGTNSPSVTDPAGIAQAPYAVNSPDPGTHYGNSGPPGRRSPGSPFQE